MRQAEMRAIPADGGCVELPNERMDLSGVCEKLRPLYGDGMPVMTVKTPCGSTVRFFGTFLPKTAGEQQQRLARAYAVADEIYLQAVREGRA